MRALQVAVAVVVLAGCSFRYTDDKVHEEASVTGSSASGSSGGSNSSASSSASSGSGSSASSSSSASGGSSSGSGASSGSSSGGLSSSSSSGSTSSAATNGSSSSGSSGSSGSTGSSGSSGCAGAAIFGAESDIPVGAFPAAILAGQFDSTGVMDLVVASEPSGSGAAGISVLHGDGAGGFVDGGFYGGLSHVPGPVSLTSADFNGDGVLDVAFAGLNGTTPGVGVMLGSAGGSFTVIVGYPSQSTAAVVRAGNFTGSTRPDLAWSGAGSLMTILSANSDGTFVPAAAFDAGTVSSFAVDDFDGTSPDDLAIVDHINGKASVLHESSNLAFTRSSIVSVGSESNGIATGDFNGDTHADLVATIYGGSSVSVVLGDGSGGLNVPPRSFPVGVEPDAVAVADFNGDLNLDLAVANYGSDSFSLLLGDGSGAFTDGGTIALAGGGKPVAISAADFNGDGKPDLAVTDTVAAGKVSVFLNTSCPGP